MVLHNAHVVAYLQSDRFWFDGSLEADHWLTMSDIAPIDAAMLLCRFNPNEEDYDVAKQATSDELEPKHLVRLAQRLQDLDRSEHKPRTLRDWHQTARDLELVYHSWIDDYMEATSTSERQPKPVPAQSTVTPEPISPIDSLGGVAWSSGPVAARIQNKTPETLAFQNAVLKYMTLVWNEWKLNHASDKTPIEPTKGEMHREVFNRLLDAGIKGKQKSPTLSMVVDAAKPWKKPLSVRLSVSQAVAPKKRHPLKGDK